MTAGPRQLGHGQLKPYRVIIRIASPPPYTPTVQPRRPCGIPFPWQQRECNLVALRLDTFVFHPLAPVIIIVRHWQHPSLGSTLDALSLTLEQLKACSHCISSSFLLLLHPILVLKETCCEIDLE